MSENQNFNPPNVSAQYQTIHNQDLPTGRLEEMQNQIKESGVYEGEIIPGSGLRGAVDVVISEGEGVRVMPNAIKLPPDHPVRGEAVKHPSYNEHGNSLAWLDIPMKPNLGLDKRERDIKALLDGAYNSMPTERGEELHQDALLPVQGKIGVGGLRRLLRRSR